MHDEPQVPVDHLVPDEEEVAPPQACGQRDRHGRRDVRAAQVVDVVVLGDDEALPLALRERVDGAMELEEDRSPLERELRRVRVRDVDRARLLAGRAVPELPARRAVGDVGHDVHLFPGLLERALEREVVAGRDDELVRRAALAKELRQRREEAVHRLRLDRLLEAPVQLVVERSRPVHRRDVLGDPGEVERPVARVAERGREVRREIGAAVEPEHRDDAARCDRLDDLRIGVPVAPVSPGREPGLVAEDRRLELAHCLARLEAELVERRAMGVVRGQGVRVATRAVEREHEELAGALAQRIPADE